MLRRPIITCSGRWHMVWIILQNHTKILKVLLDSSSIEYERLAQLFTSKKRQAK